MKGTWVLAVFVAAVLVFGPLLGNAYAANEKTAEEICANKKSGPWAVVCDALAQGNTNEVCDGVDNDGDGSIDEGFSNLGEACSVGVGACQSTGTFVCSADGFGTECSAVAGTPSAELCDGADNDCDGTTDEDFADLNQFCTGGDGVCMSGGIKVCSVDGTGTVCSAIPETPSAEVCDYLDNDCDGETDEDLLALDTSCGSCFTDCTVIFDRPNAFGVCDSSVTPTCQMQCDPSFLDADGDPTNGCESSINLDAIHVSETTGTDSALCGDNSDPCRTISFGLTRAASTGKTEVHVASGLYQETVTLVNGIDVRGGYNPVSWTHDPTINVSIIQGNTVGLHKKTIIANLISSPTLVDGFAIFGQNNPSGNSYAVWIKDSTDNLEISNNKIFAGRGGDGSLGLRGLDGSDGANGNSGLAGFQNTDNTQINQGGTGGSLVCGGQNVSGGNGGTTRGPFVFNAETSTDGANGAGSAGGFGGDAGDNPELQPGPTCLLPTRPIDGFHGANGANGANGAGGSACTSPSGSVVGNEWVGGVGGNGQDGANGSGGGGGGAGSGSESTFDNTVRFGGSGAGGGSGACGGENGSQGTAGGGSFGIFVVFNASPISVPSINNNQIYLGSGGAGGHGGNGGVGGQGGIGGAGGSAVFCSGIGGNGANGGDGGHGGGAGGSCGGASYGIYSHGQGAANLGSWSSGNIFFTIGTPGPGGSGGLSLAGPGANGQAGAQSNTNFP